MYEPATKQDSASLRGEFKADREQLRAEIRHGFDDLKETLRDIQTEMLKAFYNFAETNNKRVAQNEVNEIANRSRIETLERRVTELEQRLNTPPA